MYWEDLQLEKKFDENFAYSQSKLANAIFAYDLNKRLKAEGSDLIVNYVHPGYSTFHNHPQNNVISNLVSGILICAATMLPHAASQRFFFLFCFWSSVRFYWRLTILIYTQSILRFKPISAQSSECHSDL
jgi:hypothetical protein